MANDVESDKALHSYQCAVDLSALYARVGDSETANSNCVKHGESFGSTCEQWTRLRAGDEEGRS